MTLFLPIIFVSIFVFIRCSDRSRSKSAYFLAFLQYITEFDDSWYEKASHFTQLLQRLQ